LSLLLTTATESGAFIVAQGVFPFVWSNTCSWAMQVISQQLSKWFICLCNDFDGDGLKRLNTRIYLKIST
jgi:hypothetical protein